jgi:gamma-D-glutamyl-L-lysine dipeptidyl-peptidase
MENIVKIIHETAGQFSDFRIHVFEVSVASVDDNRLFLRGEVLEAACLDALQVNIHAAFPELELDFSAVNVLRKPEPIFLWVGTNLTSLHREPSWLKEQLSQLLSGMRLEVLKEKGSWCFVRQDDGYLGWAYRPYLTSQPFPPATHLVSAPFTRLFKQAGISSEIVSSLLAGTFVQVEQQQSGWARVSTFRSGWVSLEDLRGLDKLPATEQEKRSQIVSDTIRMTGSPYLWGGCSAFGIDCSGLAQLVHRLQGITITRDADMQLYAGKPVEPPYQPGDLVFFGDNGDCNAITHVAISLGGWEIIHSSRSQNGVYIDNVQKVEHLRKTFAGGCTYLT